MILLVLVLHQLIVESIIFLLSCYLAKLPNGRKRASKIIWICLYYFLSSLLLPSFSLLQITNSSPLRVALKGKKFHQITISKRNKTHSFDKVMEEWEKTNALKLIVLFCFILVSALPPTIVHYSLKKTYMHNPHYSSATSHRG